MDKVNGRLVADINECFDGHSSSELAAHLLEKGWREPLAKGKYRRVSDADDAQVGDLVRSRWSNGGGAIWRVTKREAGSPDHFNRRRAKLTIVSEKTGRSDTRWTNDLEIVEVTS